MITFEEHVFFYFFLLSCYSFLLLHLMWILLEDDNYPVYMYDRVCFFLMLEGFVFKTVFIDKIIIPPLTLAAITAGVLLCYFIIYNIKEKKK